MEHQQTATNQNNMRIGHELPPMLGFGHQDAKPAEAEQPDTSSPANIAASADDLGMVDDNTVMDPGGTVTTKSSAVIDHEKIKKDVHADVNLLRVEGTILSNAEHSSRTASITGLAMILGVLNRHFMNKTAEEIAAATKVLEALIPLLGRHKARTPAHLLSRIYRGNKTKQSSSDAMVLNEAIRLGKDEKTFATWIGKDGLDAMKKKLSKVARAAKLASPPPPPPPLVNLALTASLWDNACKAVVAAVKNGQSTEKFTFERSEWPDFFASLDPGTAKSQQIYVLQKTGDEIHFHLIESFQAFGPAYKPAHPIDVDKLSPPDFPDWMIDKPEGEEPKEAEDSDA